jgi:polyphenol oxidase
MTGAQMSDLNPIICDRLGVRHGFFTREGGASEGIYASLNGGVGSRDMPENIQENRTRMARWLGVATERFLSVYQVHSAICITVDADYAPVERPQADALATRVKGVALSVAAADCGPLLFADAKAGVIGAAHAGWKGAFGGVVEATIDAMLALGATRADIHAVLGPSIRKESYEVGPEFRARFMDQDARNGDFFTPSTRPGHFMFDLPGYTGRRFEKAGIGSFTDLMLDTYPDERRFFSYRRCTHRGEADYGRLISAIVL